MNEARQNPTRSWNKGGLSCNEDLTIHDIDSLILPNAINDWNWEYISACATISQIAHNPNRPWNRGGLSSNKALTVRIMDLIDREAWSLLMMDSRIHIKPAFHDLIIHTTQ